MSPSTHLALALASGVLALERRAFLQAMLSRPLLAATILGLIADRPLEALALGACLELLFLGAVNMGASLPDNDLFATAACVSCQMGLLASAPLDTSSAAAVTLLVGLPASRLGRLTDSLSDQFNARLALQLEQNPLPLRSRLRANLYGMWIPFAATACLSLAASAAGSLLLPGALALLPPGGRAALPLVWAALLVVAAAIALRSIRTGRALLYAGAALAVSVGAQAARLLDR